MDREKPSVAIIGGGPAGLMAAEVVSKAGVRVDLYDHMRSVGRKLLIAGKGGLNLTHEETRESFLSSYGPRRPQLEPILDQFGSQELREWIRGLGIETFVGTSSRVFPVEMKAGPFLHAWLERLDKSGVSIHTRYHWLGWTEDGSLQFETPEGEKRLNPKVTILALGGASWKKLGSTGEWVSILEKRGVRIAALKPANCGFNVPWSDHFQARFQGIPVKTVRATFINSKGEQFSKLGEFVVTEYGVEGSLIYAFSAQLREEIETANKATLLLDLAPGWTQERLVERLCRPRGSQTIANHLRKSVHLEGVKAGLLREFIPREEFQNMDFLAEKIKALPLPLLSPRPLDEAISTAGGVLFEELTKQLMIKSLPGVFCAGEMLDWEAPTGGYLITACLATGRTAGLGALDWVMKQ